MLFRLFFISLLILVAGFFFWGCGSTSSSSSGALSSIAVFPASSYVAPGGSVSFTANGFYANGTAASISPSWSVTSSIGTISASGVFTAIATGSGYVVGEMDGKSANAAVLVTYTGYVSGYVLDVQGLKKSNVYVYLTMLPSFSATSNSSGQYTISQVPAGTYLLANRGDASYVATTKEVTVAIATGTSINLTLNDRFSILNENISTTLSLVTGQIKNNGTTEARDVVAQFQFYDADTFLITTATSGPLVIGAGSTESFSASIVGDLTEGYTVTRSVAAGTF